MFAQKSPKTVGAERFPNGSRYIGWWAMDTDGVYLSDGFGTQYTAASDGGWTFTGFYSQNDRHGFGEIIFTEEEQNRGTIQELDGRVLGFWHRDKLHGPAFKYYPKASPHYGGVQDQENAHVSFVWFTRGRETEDSEVWVKDNFPALHEKILKDVESLNTYKIPSKSENGPKDVLKNVIEKVEANFVNVSKTLCEYMLGLASDGQHVPLSEKLQTFAKANEECFSSANATRLLATMSKSPAIYVDAPNPKAKAAEATNKTQTINKETESRHKLDNRASKQEGNVKNKSAPVKKAPKSKKLKKSKKKKRTAPGGKTVQISSDRTNAKRAKHTGCGSTKPSTLGAKTLAHAEHQRFQQMLRFVNKLFTGEHEKLTLNTIRIMVENTFSAYEIQTLLPRVLYTLDSSNRVMVVVHRL